MSEQINLPKEGKKTSEWKALIGVYALAAIPVGIKLAEVLLDRLEPGSWGAVAASVVVVGGAQILYGRDRRKIKIAAQEAQTQRATIDAQSLTPALEGYARDYATSAMMRSPSRIIAGIDLSQFAPRGFSSSLDFADGESGRDDDDGLSANEAREVQERALMEQEAQHGNN